MLEKFVTFLMSATFVAFCSEATFMPDVVYNFRGTNIVEVAKFEFATLDQIEAPNEKEKELRRLSEGKFTVIPGNEQLMNEENRDICILASIYKNFDYNSDFFLSLFMNISYLDKKGLSSCIFLVVDDKEEDRERELQSILTECEKIPNPIYFMFNDGNLGVEISRLKLFKFIKKFPSNYCCFLDSDDILHKDYMKVMSCAMQVDPEVWVILGECVILAYLESRPHAIRKYLNKPVNLDDFELTVFSKNGEGKWDLLWNLVDNAALGRLSLRRKAFTTGSCTINTRGYLPIFVRVNQAAIPEYVMDADFVFWVNSYLINLGESVKYAFVTPSSSSPLSFLYFYRLREGSCSHNEKMFEYYLFRFLFANNIVSVISGEKNVDEILGDLVVWYCPLKKMVDIQTEEIIKKELTDRNILEKQDRIIEWCKIMFKCVRELCDDNVVEARRTFNGLIDAINQSEVDKRFIISLTQQLND